MKYLFLSLLFISNLAEAKVVIPKTTAEYKEVTVMITDKFQNSGGSGVILKSTNYKSYILTNDHVCRGFGQTGGWVTTSQGEYPVERYKQSKTHDLCLIEVMADLSIDTVVSPNKAEFGDFLVVTGHPNLLPTTVTTGVLSDKLEVTLLVDVEECTEKEWKEETFLCIFFEGIPIIKNFTANSSSLFIAPGNSGSAVFNNKGHLVALAFAGIGRGISHGLLVPREYIVYFLKREIKTIKWKNASDPFKVTKLVSKAVKTHNKTLENVCDYQHLIDLIIPANKSRTTEAFSDKLKIYKSMVNKCPKR